MFFKYFLFFPFFIHIFAKKKYMELLKGKYYLIKEASNKPLIEIFVSEITNKTVLITFIETKTKSWFLLTDFITVYDVIDEIDAKKISTALKFKICERCKHYFFSDIYVTDLGKYDRVETCGKNHYTQKPRSKFDDAINHCGDFNAF